MQQHVGVAARNRAEARVEFFGHGLGPLHGDVFGEKGVGAADPGERRALEGRVEMHHLHGAVHAGVGTPRADRGHLMSSKAAQGRFEVILYGLAV